jgi:hypothetical protein
MPEDDELRQTQPLSSIAVGLAKMLGADASTLSVQGSVCSAQHWATKS